MKVMDDHELTALLTKHSAKIVDGGDGDFTLIVEGQSPTLMEATNLSDALYEAVEFLGIEL